MQDVITEKAKAFASKYKYNQAAYDAAIDAYIFAAQECVDNPTGDTLTYVLNKGVKQGKTATVKKALLYFGKFFSNFSFGFDESKFVEYMNSDKEVEETSESTKYWREDYPVNA